MVRSLFLFSGGGLFSGEGVRWLLFLFRRGLAGAGAGFRMQAGAVRPAGDLRPAEDSSPGRGLFTRLNHAGTMIFENNWLNL